MVFQPTPPTPMVLDEDGIPLFSTSIDSSSDSTPDTRLIRSRKSSARSVTTTLPPSILNPLRAGQWGSLLDSLRRLVHGRARRAVVLAKFVTLALGLLPSATLATALKTQSLAATYQSRRRIELVDHTVRALHLSTVDHSLDAVYSERPGLGRSGLDSPNVLAMATGSIVPLIWIGTFQILMDRSMLMLVPVYDGIVTPCVRVRLREAATRPGS